MSADRPKFRLHRRNPDSPRRLGTSLTRAAIIVFVAAGCTPAVNGEAPVGPTKSPTPVPTAPTQADCDSALYKEPDQRTDGDYVTLKKCIDNLRNGQPIAPFGK